MSTTDERVYATIEEIEQMSDEDLALALECAYVGFHVWVPEIHIYTDVDDKWYRTKDLRREARYRE